MSKVITKRLQTQINSYVNSLNGLSKPETRCVKDMAMGILKSKSVFVNRIAASLREPLKLKDVAKRLSAQYLKEDFWESLSQSHLVEAGRGIGKEEFLVLDGTDISKKHAKFMEGLEFVRNGDTGKNGLGYNVVNINAVGKGREITPLYSKAYSFEMGALSSNSEVKKAVGQVNNRLKGKGCWVFDRGGDNTILKDFFFSLENQAILRLKRNTQLDYKGSRLKVSQIAERLEFNITEKITKIKKDTPVVETYELAATPVSYQLEGKPCPLWLVISRNTKHGGLCYLLVKTTKENKIEVAKWAFKGYGLRWKIEEYHRHVKSQYGLEDIQIKTFNGLQSMLALLTSAMYLIYKKASVLHFALLLDAGYNYFNKYVVWELTNFIYYKIGKVVANLLMPVRCRWKQLTIMEKPNDPQLQMTFN